MHLLSLLAAAALLQAEPADAPTPMPTPTATPTPTPAELPPHTVAIRDVAVPVPRQIFETLDQFRHSNWRRVQRPELARARAQGAPPTLALLLGAVLAEGFIAVGAEDAEEARNVGRTVLKLARGLGVRDAAIRRRRSIGERVDAGDWPGVRHEWNGVLTDVEQGMRQLRSEELAPLVSLGGWLRGAEALAGLIAQNYTPEAAELLRQPALLDQFEKQLDAVRATRTSTPNLKQLREALDQIRALTAAENAQITREQVNEIGAAAGRVVEQISRPAARAPRRR